MKFNFKKSIGLIIAAGLVSLTCFSGYVSAQVTKPVAASDASIVHHRTQKVDGLDIFYREAGPKSAPTIVLLHGFPTSSQMFRNLIPKLADKYHVIAPDYPGFGQSSMPSRSEFEYTFDNLATVVDHFLEQLKVGSYVLYVQDYGAPIDIALPLRIPSVFAVLLYRMAMLTMKE